MLKNLIMIELSFLCKKKILTKLKWKNNICINVLGYENGLVFPIYVSDQKFEDSIDFLLLNHNINHIMCTSKILTDLCFAKQKIKTKNGFVKVVYSVLVAKMCW